MMSVAHGRPPCRSCRKEDPSTQDKTPQAVQAHLVTTALDFSVSAMGVWQSVSTLTWVHLFNSWSPHSQPPSTPVSRTSV